MDRTYLYYTQNRKWKIIGDRLPTKRPIESKDIFNADFSLDASMKEVSYWE